MVLQALVDTTARAAVPDLTRKDPGVRDALRTPGLGVLAAEGASRRVPSVPREAASASSRTDHGVGSVYRSTFTPTASGPNSALPCTVRATTTPPSGVGRAWVRPAAVSPGASVSVATGSS